MKDKINKSYKNLKDIADKNKNSEAYQKHLDRAIFKNSVAMAIVQFIFMYILKSNGDTAIVLGIKLSSLAMFFYIFTKHMKQMGEGKMKKGNSFFAFIHLIIESYIVLAL